MGEHNSLLCLQLSMQSPSCAEKGAFGKEVGEANPQSKGRSPVHLENHYFNERPSYSLKLNWKFIFLKPLR